MESADSEELCRDRLPESEEAILPFSSEHLSASHPGKEAASGWERNRGNNIWNKCRTGDNLCAQQPEENFLNSRTL